MLCDSATTTTVNYDGPIAITYDRTISMADIKNRDMRHYNSSSMSASVGTEPIDSNAYGATSCAF
jgi:hypothetical protein